MCAEGQARPPGQAISKSDAASGRGKEVAVQERRERLAGRAPVPALERTVIFRRPGWDPLGCLHVHTCLLVFVYTRKYTDNA